MFLWLGWNARVWVLAFEDLQWSYFSLILYGPFVKGKNLEDMNTSNDLYGSLPIENIINFKGNE